MSSGNLHGQTICGSRAVRNLLRFRVRSQPPALPCDEGKSHPCTRQFAAGGPHSRGRRNAGLRPRAGREGRSVKVARAAKSGRLTWTRARARSKPASSAGADSPKRCDQRLHHHVGFRSDDDELTAPLALPSCVRIAQGEGGLMSDSSRPVVISRTGTSDSDPPATEKLGRVKEETLAAVERCVLLHWESCQRL